MSSTLKLLLVGIGAGAIMGLLVLGAARAAGRKTHKGLIWLGGTVWGFLIVSLSLTGCASFLHGSGRLADMAFPLFFGGVACWPVAAAWRQPHWFLSWLFAQLVMLVTVVPAFLVAVVGALCVLT